MSTNAAASCGVMSVEYFPRIADTKFEVRDRVVVVMPSDPGHLDVIPPGHPFRVSRRRQAELVVAALDAEFFAQKAAESLGEARQLLARDDAVDPFMHAVGNELRGDFLAARLPGNAFLQSLAGVIAVHLARADGARTVIVPEAGLAPRKLSYAVAIIEERLADDVHLDQLAAAVHLSTYHFARMFKRAMGQAPHAYITTQRVEHAKSLLRNSDL